MRCPFCDHHETDVKDSRPAEGGGYIRRRRKCVSCGRRFTTFEVLVEGDDDDSFDVPKNGNGKISNRHIGLMPPARPDPVIVGQARRLLELLAEAPDA